MARSYWESWISTLSETDADAATQLRDRFASLGAPNPEDWAGSEIREGIAQLARFLVLRRLWQGAMDGWRDRSQVEAVPAAKRLLDSGADFDDVSRAMRVAAYEATFGVLEVIDEGYDPESEEGLPMWSLREMRDDVLTGRPVGGLHESFQSLDPSGTDGADLWD